MPAVCIIPARGGSQRVPRKNIRPLAGRPLLAWTVETALASQLFATVMVSTDDSEIAEIARAAGAEVPFLRSAASASHVASTVEVLDEVLRAYAQISQQFAIGCCLYPAAVLVTAAKLRQGALQLEQDAALDGVLSMLPYSHPIERAFRIRDGYAGMIDESVRLTRTQDLEPAYHDAGQFYWFRPDRMLTTGRLLGDRCAPVLLERWEAVDLDSEADWRMLERLAHALLPRPR